MKLFTHFVVREDAQLFFGFSTKTERELFRQLISVSGVGGNTARMILSTYSPRELQSIITTENAVLLKNVKGLGLKTAQKIIVELSGKLTALFDGDAGPLPVAGNGDAVYDEATAALVMLGFPQSGFGQGRPGHSQRATRHLGRRDRPHVAQTALNLQLHPETHTT